MKVESGYECPVHLVHHEVEIPDESEPKYNGWKAGWGHIQDMLPFLSATDRETLMTGMCSETWDSMFPDEDCSNDCDGSGHRGLFCR